MNQSLVLFSCVCSWWLLACVSLTTRRVRVSMTSRFCSSSNCYHRHVSGIGMSRRFRFSCGMALLTSTRCYSRDGSAAGEYQRGFEGEASLRTNQRVANCVEDQSWFGNPSKPLESAICSHRARSAQTTVGLGDWHAPEPPVTDLQTRDGDELW